VSNKPLSRNFALLIATTLSAAMLIAASPISPFGLAPAFAAASNVNNILEANIRLTQEENNSNNEVGGSGSVVNTAEQESIQGGTNVNQDNDVVVGTCEDGNVEVNDDDEVTQTIIESANQEVNRNNNARNGGTIASTVAQSSAQDATNINLDNDLIIILDCHGQHVEVNDDDEVTQTIIQSANQ
jgi:hypothetical protein